MKKERKTWDKEEYREKAKKKDAEEREEAQKNEERMRQGMFSSMAHLLVTESPLGKKPIRRNPAKNMPKPTETMKRREESLEIDKNLGKTMVVSNPSGRGPGQPGFYCEVCNRNHKDSNSYLDHLNSRSRAYTAFLFTSHP